MSQLQPLHLVVDVAIDNVTDSYSSKPAHVSPEFNNVIEAGAKELSGVTLCCAQLGLALVLNATVGQQHYKLLFDAGPEGALFLRNCQTLGVGLVMWAPSQSRMATGIIWARCLTPSTISPGTMEDAKCPVTSIRACFWSAGPN